MTDAPSSPNKPPEKTTLQQRLDQGPPVEGPTSMTGKGSGALPPPVLPTGNPRVEEVKRRLQKDIIDDLGPKMGTGKRPFASLVEEAINARLAVVTNLSSAERERIATELHNDILGYGPLERLLRDPEITEIMVNRYNSIWIETKGRLMRTTLTFDDEDHLRRIIQKMAEITGRRIDESSPMVDARLPDGSRVNGVVPPLAIDGSTLTIRKFSKMRFDFDEMIRLHSLTKKAAFFLDIAVAARLSMLVSGGTGSGKTTLLNALSSSIPDDERIITIEDAAELRLNQEHVIRLESRQKNIEGAGEVTIRDLVRNALRMRPDRILVGECRGAEALDMLQAMNTGHDGSLSTVHANSPRDALARIETMVMMAGFDLPLRAIRAQIASAIDLIVHIERFEDGSRRVSAISEVGRMEGDEITLQDLFLFKRRPGGSGKEVVGELISTGIRPDFDEKFEKRGIILPTNIWTPGAA